MECIACLSPPRYKCTKCRQPYCSVPCFKTHQLSCSGQTPQQTVQVPIPPQEQIIKTDYLSDQELRLPQSQLIKLKNDPKLKEMLKDESLRQKLLQIDNSKQRMTEVLQAMKSEQFHSLYQKVMEVLFEGAPPE